MGELRRFIKSNNIIMRLVSLVLTVAILASALVYFGNEKMDKMYNNSKAELNRLCLSLEEETEIAKKIAEEANKACANCQEDMCEECVYADWR